MLSVGILDDMTGETVVKSVTNSDVTTIPKRSLHYEINLSCKPAYYLSVYNSGKPEAPTIIDTYSMFKNPLSDIYECMQRCKTDPKHSVYKLRFNKPKYQNEYILNKVKSKSYIILVRYCYLI